MSHTTTMRMSVHVYTYPQRHIRANKQPFVVVGVVGALFLYVCCGAGLRACAAVRPKTSPRVPDNQLRLSPRVPHITDVCACGYVRPLPLAGVVAGGACACARARAAVRPDTVPVASPRPVVSGARAPPRPSHDENRANKNSARKAVKENSSGAAGQPWTSFGRLTEDDKVQSWTVLSVRRYRTPPAPSHAPRFGSALTNRPRQTPRRRSWA